MNLCRGPLALLPMLLVLQTAPKACAVEEILSYYSDIVVHPDASMTVTETIHVRAEGNQIKRGIYRDFPTKYKDRLGNRYVVGFDVVAVQRDGRPDGHHTEGLSNGTRVYIGKKSVMLAPGEYRYQLTYKTRGQLGFFEDHDELYWNVTGNGWDFSIKQASATVSLPPGVPVDEIRMQGYTGAQGSKATDLVAALDDEGCASFQTTKPLGLREGLTIVASFPKGFVRQPTFVDGAKSMLLANPATRVALVGLTLVAIYYVVVWFLVGMDPAKGTVIPRFEPPRGISPGAARYIMRMGYDNKCFAAVLIHLAVKRRLSIEESGDEYEVKRTGTSGSQPWMSPGESQVFSKLLGARSRITLKQSNHSTIGGAVEALKKALAKEHRKHHFVANGWYTAPGVVLTLITFVIIAIAFGGEEGRFFSMWLSIWTLGVAVLVRQLVATWRGVTRKTIVGALGLSLFGLPFFVAEIFVVGLMARRTSPMAMGLLLLAVALVMLFQHLLKAPTKAGRKLMDELEGFRMYLSVAERDTLRAMRGPEKTPELFETYLPYALALDVEQEWSEQFADVLEAAGRAGGGD
ncbi:MAG: DUF2207 domain-containing protein, partial [Verrucomicrobia bacterium]|nr:DUF2207 domain-containing protein [Verrucomicrobiota bacterium]